VRGADRPEAPVADRRDVGSAEAFGDRDHGGVRRAQWEVGVLATRSAIRAKSWAVVGSTISSLRAGASRNAASAAGPGSIWRKRRPR